MVTSATVLSAGPRSGQQLVAPPTDAVLLDADGATLSWVGRPCTIDDGRLMLDEVDEPDVLLRYYFGRGGRHIMIRLTEGMLEGRLETCWDGDRRRWWLELTEVPRPV